MNTELAKYSVKFEIEGMKVPGIPEGVGDRRIVFEIDLDPSDIEAATIGWYLHLQAMLGPDEMEKIKAGALEMARGR